MIVREEGTRFELLMMTKKSTLTAGCDTVKIGGNIATSPKHVSPPSSWSRSK
jgi:hypothetical protein